MKKICLFAATAAIALSSCSKNEVLEVANPNENPNAIGLSTGAFATKSIVTDAETLQDEGVTLYSTDVTFGDLSFTYSTATSKWTNDDGQDWADILFDMSVYSAHDGGNVQLTIPTSSAAAAGDIISFTYDVEDEVTVQKDLVYFGKTLSAIPTSGVISATYKHALSRIKMQETTEDMTTDVIDVYLIGFDGSATAKIDPTDNAIEWDGVDAVDKDYAYDLENEATAENDMFIIPKETADFTSDGTNVPTSGVTALCITEIGDTPVVGFESVDAFKKDNPKVEKVVIASSGLVYDGKMYVKAVFPINKVTFSDGTYYNLQLNFAGASVYYYDDNYYSEDGDELEIEGEQTTPGPDEGDPLNPTATDKIGLTVIVNPWPADGENTDL